LRKRHLQRARKTVLGGVDQARLDEAMRGVASAQQHGSPRRAAGSRILNAKALHRATAARLLNYVVAIYLILVGVIGINSISTSSDDGRALFPIPPRLALDAGDGVILSRKFKRGPRRKSRSSIRL
jgi:hypothetical protein